MTAMNFPLDPSDGDIHDNYVYDATHGVWNQNPQQLAARFISSDTAPTSPSTGDAWFDTETGKTYIYHDSSWVESGNPVIGFVDPYDQATTSTGYLALPKGTSDQRPVAPSNGDIRFNTDLGEPEYYSEAESDWFLFRQAALSGFDVEYLVIAGGGGGGYDRGGGGGAGGYRCNVTGESSGGGASAEASLPLSFGTYTVTVGAGGAGSGSLNVRGSSGEDSVFDTITSLGGGGAGSPSTVPTGLSGGSGGGGATTGSSAGGAETSGQGFAGGPGVSSGSFPSGGGGGAGEAGNTDGNAAGGDGVSSSITGSAVTRGGGGSGQDNNTVILGGDGGGGNGASEGDGLTPATAGQANTGGGGGGGGGTGVGGVNQGKAGGSGIVIIKYPSSVNITVDPGLVSETNTVGDYKITEFTDGTGDITFS